MRGLVLLAALAWVTMRHPLEAQNLREMARSSFVKAPTQESSAKGFLNRMQNEPSNDVVLRGYEAGMKMIMARHVVLPWSKWMWFSEGRDQLESLIETNPEQPELIFIRYSIQTNIPAFLGYNRQIDRDRRWLEQQVNELHDAALKRMIRNYLPIASKAKNATPQLGNNP